jgi:hypothetical protein
LGAKSLANGSGGLECIQASAGSQASLVLKGAEMIRTKNASTVLLICVMILACLSIVAWSNRTQASAKVVWEYKVVSLNQRDLAKTGEPDRIMSQLGADGWEFVQFISSGNPIGDLSGNYFFKRAK